LRAKLPRYEKWRYSLGTVGRDMASCLFSTYLLTFVLFTKSLSDLQFAAINTIMVACRLFDMGIDPTIGSIIENTRSRFGKFKPALAVGAVANAGVLLFAFSNSLEGWLFVGAFACMYLLWDISFSFNDIAYWSMLPALSSGRGDRDSITSLAMLCSQGGGGLTSVVVPLFTAGALTIGGDAITAYRSLTVIIILFFLGCTALVFFGVRAREYEPLMETERTGPLTMLRLLRENDQLLWAALVFLLFQTGSSLWIASLPMYVYLEFGYHGILVTVFLVLGAIMGALANLFYDKLAARLARKRLLQMAMACMGFGYGAILLSNALWPVSYPALIVFTMVANLGQAIFALVLSVSLSNTVEYNEWKFGARNEGVIFSLRSLMGKLGSAAVQAVLMGVYLAAGVITYTNKISHAENLANRGLISADQKAASINTVISFTPQATKTAMRVAVCGSALLLLITAYLILQHKYKIDEKLYERMLREIEKKKRDKERKKNVAHLVRH
jgi:melibiose permease/lactose/raffinose/galactose permease